MTATRLSKNWLIVAWYGVFLGFIMGLDASYQRLLSFEALTPGALFEAVTFHYRWVPETLVLVLGGIWATSGGKVARTCYYALSVQFFAINVLQIGAIVMSQSFVSTLALDNIGHLNLLLNARTLAGIGAFLVTQAAYIWSIERAARRRPSAKRENWAFSSAGLACWCLAVTPLFLPDGIRSHREWLFSSRMNGETPPVTSLLQVLVHPASRQDRPSKLSRAQLELAEKFGFELFSAEVPGYPTVKEQIYAGAPPFDTADNGTQRPNVIIFFTEGLSSRLLGFNSPERPGITPNIDAFQRDSRVMTVDNYYNHTAATYRGLTGQLCSLYPTFGGLDGWDQFKVPPMHYLCLPDIFRKHRYQTVFWDCHRKGAAHIRDLVARDGFERVYNAEEMSATFLGGAETLRSDAVSDKQLLTALVGYLKQRQANDVASPLFLGVYNLGTHANTGSTADATAFGDGSNSVLNNLHSYDVAFGVFWRWFQQSEYAKNTVIVFTGDHAHYPEPDMIAAAGAAYQPYFVDRMPLLFYDPTRKLPRRFDANYSTSIDFAPTLVQYLGFPNHRNGFLGTSLFTKAKKPFAGLGLASWDNEYFFIDRDGIHHNPRFGPYAPLLDDVGDIVDFTHRLEVSDKMWNHDWDSKYLALTAE